MPFDHAAALGNSKIPDRVKLSTWASPEKVSTPPYGALSELVREARDGQIKLPAVADRLRSWRL